MGVPSLIARLEGWSMRFCFRQLCGHHVAELGLGYSSAYIGELRDACTNLERY